MQSVSQHTTTLSPAYLCLVVLGLLALILPRLSKFLDLFVLATEGTVSLGTLSGRGGREREREKERGRGRGIIRVYTHVTIHMQDIFVGRGTFEKYSLPLEKYFLLLSCIAYAGSCAHNLLSAPLYFLFSQFHLLTILLKKH